MNETGGTSGTTGLTSVVMLPSFSSSLASGTFADFRLAKKPLGLSSLRMVAFSSAVLGLESTAIVGWDVKGEKRERVVPRSHGHG